MRRAGLRALARAVEPAGGVRIAISAEDAVVAQHGLLQSMLVEVLARGLAPTIVRGGGLGRRAGRGPVDWSAVQSER